MKAGIHPEYMTSRITCACGRVTETRATVEEIHVEICSHCHPFYTGRQKLVDTAGRVERFRRKYSSSGDADEAEGEDASPEAVEAGETQADETEGEADDAPTPVAAGAAEADESDDTED